MQAKLPEADISIDPPAVKAKTKLPDASLSL